ncbi:MAG: flagellar assembly protein FliW [Psychrobacillus sp.]
MNIETKFLGSMAIDEKDIIQFPDGIPGFEEIKEFVILPLEKDSPFAVLQSIKEQKIGFVIAFPFVFKKDYTFDVLEDDKEDLQIEAGEDLITYSIVTLRDPFQHSTLNLQAPILINFKKKLAKQLVLQDATTYPIRFPIEGSAI